VVWEAASSQRLGRESLPSGTGQGSLEFNAKDLTVSYSQPVKLGNSGIKGDISVEVNGKEKNLTFTFCEN